MSTQKEWVSVPWVPFFQGGDSRCVSQEEVKSKDIVIAVVGPSGWNDHSLSLGQREWSDSNGGCGCGFAFEPQ